MKKYIGNTFTAQNAAASFFLIIEQNELEFGKQSLINMQNEIQKSVHILMKFRHI